MEDHWYRQNPSLFTDPVVCPAVKVASLADETDSEKRHKAVACVLGSGNMQYFSVCHGHGHGLPKNRTPLAPLLGLMRDKRASPNAMYRTGATNPTKLSKQLHDLCGRKLTEKRDNGHKRLLPAQRRRRRRSPKSTRKGKRRRERPAAIESRLVVQCLLHVGRRTFPARSPLPRPQFLGVQTPLICMTLLKSKSCVRVRFCSRRKAKEKNIREKRLQFASFK